MPKREKIWSRKRENEKSEVYTKVYDKFMVVYGRSTDMIM